MIPVLVNSHNDDWEPGELTPTRPGHHVLPVERCRTNPMAACLTASRWTLSDVERARIAAGDDVILTVMGETHPALVLSVGVLATPRDPEDH